MGILQMWEDLMQKAKDGGIDVIDTYVFWSGHEPSRGNVGLFILISLPLFLFLRSFYFSNVTAF